MYMYVTSTISWCLGAETKGLQGTIMAIPTNAHHPEDQKTQLPHTLTLHPTPALVHTECNELDFRS